MRAWTGGGSGGEEVAVDEEHVLGEDVDANGKESAANEAVTGGDAGRSRAGDTNQAGGS